MWGHRKNAQTEMWSSTDGINFIHQGISIKAANIGTRNATYSRTYKYPIKKYDSQYVMFYSDLMKKKTCGLFGLLILKMQETGRSYRNLFSVLCQAGN